MTEAPLAYKFVGKYYTWLIKEQGHGDEEVRGCQPIYALIEDEE